MLSPEEIRSRTFLVSLRGYDREEVAAFLDEVAKQMASAAARLEEAQAGGAITAETDTGAVSGEAAGDHEAPAERSGQAATAESPFAQIGQETERILVAAQEAGDSMREKAREAADQEVKAARTQAARIIAEGERRRESIEQTVQALEESRSQLAEDFRGLGRTVERVLRELAPTGESATTVREAMAAAAREGDGDAGEAVDAPAGAGAGEDDDSVQAAPDLATGAEDVAPALGDDEQARRTAPEEASPPEEAGTGADEHGAPPAGASEAAVLDEDRLFAPEEAVEPAPDGEPERTRVEGGVDESVRAPGTRAEALATLHPKLVRRLKRGLQDIQNSTLDLLRRDTRHDDPERFLPDDSTTTVLGEAARELLEAAYLAGQREAGVVGEATADPTSRSRLGDELSLDFGVRIGQELRSELGKGFAQEDELTALSERVEAVFAGLRDEPVGEVGAVGLVNAYEWGRHDAWRERGVPARTWILAQEPPCTDPRCMDNVNAGPVVFGESFPSGHHVPPSGPECACTTAPQREPT